METAILLQFAISVTTDNRWYVKIFSAFRIKKVEFIALGNNLKCNDIVNSFSLFFSFYIWLNLIDVGLGKVST